MGGIWIRSKDGLHLTLVNNLHVKSMYDEYALVTDTPDNSFLLLAIYSTTKAALRELDNITTWMSTLGTEKSVAQPNSFTRRLQLIYDLRYSKINEEDSHE